MSKRWRIILVFPVVLVGACVMLFLDVLLGLVSDVRKAWFTGLVAVIEWAGVTKTAKQEQSTNG